MFNVLSTLNLGENKSITTIPYKTNLKLKIPNNFTKLPNHRYILDSEVPYIYNNYYSNNTKSVPTSLDVNTLYKLPKYYKYPILFDFNVFTNLATSKEHRWLTRNSLLSQSLTSNNYLITQSKKLIGTSSINKDLSSKSL
jgi:hypothetical protein